MKIIIDKILTIIYNPEYIKKFLTDENYLNYLESLYQDLSREIEYSTENKIMQYFKKIIKESFFSNFDILDYIKTNLNTIKSNFDMYINRVRTIQKDIYFIGMVYGYYNEEHLFEITDKLEKFSGDYKEINFRTKKMKVMDKDKNNIVKIINSFHGHIIITRAYTFRGALNDNPNYSFNRNAIGNFYQIGKRDLHSNLMMTLVEMIWGNLFKININRKENNKIIGNVITTSKKIIDNIMVLINYKYKNYQF
jgi:hypothetical protein